MDYSGFQASCHASGDAGEDAVYNVCAVRLLVMAVNAMFSIMFRPVSPQSERTLVVQPELVNKCVFYRDA
jgi:hypothetical protein